MYKYLFGPVPSRRLGMSLGVDLVPRKVCSLDCIYCEVGKTTALTLDRKEYIPAQKIMDELLNFFDIHPDPDYFTFSGSGEPTLNSAVGKVLRFIKEQKPNIPVAVLTNGTLMYDPEVRKELMAADLVLPSVDAASDEVMKKLNKPVAGLSAEKHIQGLISFSQEFKGSIWLEVMIIPGFNDHPEELQAIKKAILQINPERVQLNTLDRPGTEKNIRAASPNELKQIVKLWDLPQVEIISKASTRKRITGYLADIEGAILETISRRPCTLDDLSSFLGLHISEINKYLDTLEAEGKIEAIWQTRGLFYTLKQE